MIFESIDEKRDINDYRHKALKRKMKMDPNFKGVNQIEFEFLECLERILELNDGMPYVFFEEVGEFKSDDQNSKRIYCTKDDNGRNVIRYGCGTISDFYDYTNLIFGKPWPEYKIKREMKAGKIYKPYNRSIYSYSYFEFFKKCKNEIETYTTKMAIWFTSLHEYAHIINGHLDCKSAMMRGEMEYDIELLRAMEIHADITAAYLLLMIMAKWECYVGKTSLYVNVKGKDFIPVFSDDLVFAAIGAYLALRSNLNNSHWDEYTVGMHEQGKEEHPLIEVRMHFVYRIFANELKKYQTNDENTSGFDRDLYIAISQFEDFYCKNIRIENTGKEFYSPTKIIQSEDGKLYYKKMFSSVIRLNDVLKNYATRLFVTDGEWYDYDTLERKHFYDE